MTIQEVQKFLDDQPAIESGIKEIITKSIEEKKSALPKKDFDVLITSGTLNPYTEDIPTDRFRLDYDSLVVDEVLLRKAKEILGRDFPANILGALQFVNQICEEIRKPNIRTFWYEHLESGFETYALIYLNHIHGVDVSAFLYAITKEDRDQEIPLRVYEHNYTGAFSHINDNIETSYQTIEFFYSKPDSAHFALSCVDKIAKKNPAKAAMLYDYAKVNKAERYDRLLPALLIELYPIDRELYFKEAIELHGKDPVQGLSAISFYKYQDATEIEKAFTFISDEKKDDTNYKRVLVDFYCRLIENLATPATLRSECFALLRELFIKTDDEQVKLWLIRRISMVNGNDGEKFGLLPDLLAYNAQAVLNNFFDYFENPSQLFGLVKDGYLHHGMRVNLDLFKHAISMQFHRHPEACENELLKMLTHDLAIVRYAGVQILTSNVGRAYNVDFLKLDEEGQERVIETILFQPIGIEELLPLILQLRNSPFPQVQELLTNQLVSLIWAYDRHLIEHVNRHLDVTNPADKQLQGKLEEGYKTYATEKQLRNSINEFNPSQNEVDPLRLYFRLEAEKNAEIMERASSNSFFTELAKTITVIRGNAFKSEANPAITKLETISTSRLVDQRYYVDPEYYEWTFQLNAYGKNYGSTE